MRDIVQFLLLLWVVTCTTLAAHFRARLVEELKPDLDTKDSGSPGDHTEVGKKYHRRFVMTVVLGLGVFALGFLFLLATN